MSYDELVETVRRYWEDMDRPASETKDDLRGLIDEIEMLIESMSAEDE